jgi:SNF2 family DNA or RNA helicase
MIEPNTEFLFTRQRHEADRMGLHYDLRLVHGDKAYSFATKKDMPGPGEIIGVFEQPVHDRAYALSKKVVIPAGQWGAGTTYLDWIRKAKVADHSTEDKLIIYTKDGEKFLLKKSPTKENETSWIFRNITGMGKSENPYLKKIKAEKEPKIEVEKQASTNIYLIKIAKQEAKKQEVLKKHQEEALAQLEESGGIILHHSTGSGKTKTFLEAIRRNQEKNKGSRSLIIAPASLTTNIDKEIAKHKIKLDRALLDVYSYEKATNIADQLRKNKYGIVVADEAHRLRNNKSKRVKELRDIISSADQRVLATATGTYNDLADMSTLVNIAANDEVLPEDRKAMEERYTKIDKEKVGILGKIMGEVPVENRNLTRKKELGEKLNKYVHYYDNRDDPEAAKKFPTKTEKVIDVEMSPEQDKYYRFTEGKIPFLLRVKLRHNLPLDKKERANLNAFSTGVRQVSNGYSQLKNDGKAEITPKIKKAVESLELGLKEDKNFRGLVYSNYLSASLGDYSKHLTSKKIAHNVYDGSLNREEKDRMVKEYNSGKTKVLLVSSSGAEGIDLKGTKKIQILEPHFNPSKIRQIVGRGVRYESHSHLPEDERHVDVEHYHSVHPKPMWGKSPTTIDKYLYEHSDDKQDLFEQLQDVMKGPKKDE